MFEFVSVMSPLKLYNRFRAFTLSYTLSAHHSCLFFRVIKPPSATAPTVIRASLTVQSLDGGTKVKLLAFGCRWSRVSVVAVALGGRQQSQRQRR